MQTHDGWPYQPYLCECDDQFVEYMSTQPPDHNVFHMGPGLHHRVGRTLNSKVITITNSPEEMQSYIDIIIATPELSYICIFHDIHDLDWTMLPRFQYITLFHLGEVTERPISPVILKAKLHLHPGGQFLLYRKSGPYHRVLHTLLDQLGSVENRTYKDLTIVKPIKLYT